eukprot:1394684-Amphidinium_carterae.1
MWRGRGRPPSAEKTGGTSLHMFICASKAQKWQRELAVVEENVAEVDVDADVDEGLCVHS